MGSWVFRGVLLPEGEDGEVLVGDGEQSTLPGRYAVTGLVDAHCHVTVDVDANGFPFISDRAFADRQLAGLADQGVAVARDVGGDSAITLDFAASTRPGLPVVVAAGRFHSTRDRYFPRMYTPCDPDDLDASIRHEVAGGATWVKIITDFPEVVDGVPGGEGATTYDEQTLARAVQTAHSVGARVAAHSTMAASTVVGLGVDSIEHGNGLTEDDVKALGARGGAWTPTIGALTAAAEHLPPEHLPVVEALKEHYRHHLPIALRAGVTVMAGSDASVPVARDIALLAEHGLTPLEAIRAATVSARSYLQMPPSDDLVTYDDDPRDDPAVLARPRAVVLRGQRVR
ncbi:MAG: amidohydrolase family protein [Nocardioides sp.]